MNKPMILAMEEAESIMTSAVNQILASGVTPYFAEIVVEKVHRELRNLAREETDEVAKNYKLQQEKEILDAKRSEANSNQDSEQNSLAD